MEGGYTGMSSNSNHVDNRVVNMQFNNEQFEAGVKQTIQSLDELKQSLNLNTSVTGLNTIQSAFNHFSISNMASSLDTLTSRFSTLGIVGMTAIQNITNKMMDLASSKLMNAYNTILTGGKSRASTAARAKFTLEGMFDGAEDKAEKVETAFQSARDAVTGTAYTMSSAVSVASQLAATGVDVGDELKNILLGVAGVASMTGDTFDNIGNIYTTIAGNGKLMGIQLNQLSSHGLNAAAIIAKHLNTTEAEVRDMVHRGEISFDIFSDAMYSAFGTHAQEANKTFSGVTDNIKSNLSRIGEVFYSGIYQNDDLIKFLDNFRLALGKVREKVTDLEEPFKNLVSAISKVMSIKVVKLGFNGFSKFVDIVKKAMNALTGFIERYWDLSNTIHDSALGRAVEATAEQMDKVTKISEKQYYIAKKIWEGPNAWGNGEERMKKLGIDYKYVQAYVNALKEANFDESKVAIQVMGRNKEAMDGVTDASETALDSVEDVTEGYSTFEAVLAGIMSFSTGIKNVYSSAKNIGKSLYKSFKRIFSIVSLAKDLSFMGKLFSQMSGYFAINEERAGKLERAFAGLWAAIDIIKRTMQTLAQFIADTFGPIFSKLFDIFLTVIAYIGDAIVAVNEWEKEHGILSATFKLLSTVIRNVIEIIKEFFTKLVDLPAVKKITEKLKELGSYISETFGPKIETVTGYIENFFDKLDSEGKGGAVMTAVLEGINWLLEKAIDLFKFLKGAVVAVFDWFKGKKDVVEGAAGGIATVTESVSKLSDATEKVTKKSGFIGFLDNMADAFGIVGSGIGKFIAGIVEGFKKINVFKVGLFGLVASLTAFSAGLGYFFTKVGKAVGMFKAIGDSVIGAFDAVKDTLNSFTEVRKMDARVKMIKAVALAIAVLTLSLIALTFVDQKKLRNATIALSAVMIVLGTLAIVMLQFAKKVKNSKQTETTLRAMATALILFAGAIWIISDAIAKLASIKWKNGILKPLGALITIIAIMTVVAILLADVAPELSKGGFGLLTFASSVWLVVKSMEKLNGLDVEDIKPKLEILYKTLLVLGAVALLASHFKFSGAVGLVTMVASLWIIEKVLHSIAENGVTMDDLKNKITPILATLGMILAVIVVLTIINEMAEGSGMNPSKAGSALLKAAVAILILSKVINYLGKMDVERSSRGVVILKEIVYDLLTILLGIALVQKDIKHIGGTVLKIATAIGVMAIIVALMGMLDPKAVDQGLKVVDNLAVMVMLMIAVTHVARKIDFKAIWAMVGAITVMSVILMAFVVLNRFTELYSAVGALGITLLALGTSMYLASVAAKKATPKSILAMVLALAVIGGVLFVLARMNWVSLLAAALAISGVMLAMGAAFKVFMSAFTDKDGKSVAVSKQRITMLTQMILAVAVIGAALAGITAVAGKDYGTVIAAAISISLVLAAIMGVMIGITKFSAKKPSKELLTEIALMIVGIIAIASSLALLISLNAPWTSFITPVIAIGAILAALVTAMVVINKMANKKMSTTNVVALGIMILGIVAIASSLALLLNGNYNWSQMLVAALSMSLVLAAVVGALYILSKISSTESGGIGMLIATVAVVASLAVLAVTLPAISKGIMMLADALSYFAKAQIPIKSMLKFVLIMALVSVGAVIAAAALAVLGVAVLVLGAGVVVLGTGLLFVATAFTMVVTALALITPMLPILSKSLKTLAKSIVVSMKAVAKGVALALVSFFTTIADNKDKILEGLDALVSIIAKSVSAGVEILIEIIANGLSKLLDKIAELIPKVMAIIVALLKALADNADTIAESLVKIVIGILAGLFRGITNYLDKNSKKIAEGVLNLLWALAKTIYNVFKLVCGWVWDLFMDVFTQVAAKAVDLWNHFEDQSAKAELLEEKQRYEHLIADGEYMDKEGKMHKATEEDIKNWQAEIDRLQNEYDEYKTTGDEMLAGRELEKQQKREEQYQKQIEETNKEVKESTNIDLSDNGESSASTWADGWSDFLDSSDLGFDSIWNNGKEAAEEAGGATAEDFVKKVKKQIEVSKIPDETINNMLLQGYQFSDDHKYLEKEVSAGFKDAVEVATDGVLSTTDLYEEADEVIKTLGEKGQQAGKDWLAGIEESIRTSPVLKAIQSGVRKVAELVDKKFRLVLDEHSPSRKGYEAGEFWVLGINNGIRSLLTLPSETTAKIGNAMIDTIGNTMKDIYTSLGSMDDIQPTITPVVDMSNINQASGYINANLSVGSIAADTSVSFNEASQQNLAMQVQALSEQVKKLAETDYSTMLEGVNINVDASTKVDGTPLRQMASTYTIEQIDESQRGLILATGGRV